MSSRDSVAELLIRRDIHSSSSVSSNPASTSSSSSSSSRPSTAFSHQKQDHVGFILLNIPPTPTDREAFGINSISHKKRITNTLSVPSVESRQSAEADRFYNGIAETRAQRKDTQGLMNLRYDSSAVASSLILDHGSAASTGTRNNRPTQTTFDIHDAVRTASGLLLPEPNGHHKGHTVTAVDNLVPSAVGLTPASYVKERDELTLNKGRLDRNRDQYGTSVKEVFGMVKSSGDDYYGTGTYPNNTLKPGRPVENHVMHPRNHTHLYQGLGTAEALVRPSDFLPAPHGSSVVGHDNEDRSNDTIYRTTYSEQHTGATVGEPKASPTKRRYYGGATDHGRNDPYKKTQIY